MFLLDTNVLSELRRNKPHGGLLAWYRKYPESAYYVPSVALYEMQAGVEVIRRQDSQKAGIFERWIDEIASVFPILDFDVAAARETARLMYQKKEDLLEDAMIAAIANSRGLIVATRNRKHFSLLKTNFIDPFSEK